MKENQRLISWIIYDILGYSVSLSKIYISELIERKFNINYQKNQEMFIILKKIKITSKCHDSKEADVRKEVSFI